MVPASWQNFNIGLRKALSKLIFHQISFLRFILFRLEIDQIHVELLKCSFGAEFCDHFFQTSIIFALQMPVFVKSATIQSRVKVWRLVRCSFVSHSSRLIPTFLTSTPSHAGGFGPPNPHLVGMRGRFSPPKPPRRGGTSSSPKSEQAPPVWLRQSSSHSLVPRSSALREWELLLGPSAQSPLPHSAKS